MSKVIAICGMIGSGIGPYVNLMKEKENAILFSNDEIFKAIYIKEMNINDYLQKANEYLMKRSIELLDLGNNVILDWGFKTKIQRDEVTNYYKVLGYKVEWHYIDVDLNTVKKHLEKRKKTINTTAEETFFTEEFIDEYNNNFEIPNREEIDIWYKSLR